MRYEWSYKRIKDLCDFINRGTTPNYIEKGPFKVINQATFSKGDFDVSNIRFSTNNKKEALVKKGDLLIASTGGGVLGKVYYFEETTTDYYADSHVTIMCSSDNVTNTKFLYYFFSVNYYMINALLAKGSTNQTELQKNELLNLVLKIPTISTQIIIADYLDKKTSQIASQIALLEKKRDTYSRLKKSLIHKVVTKGLNPDVELKDSGIDWLGKIPKHWGIKRVKDVGFMYSGLSGKTGEDFRNEDENTNKYFIPYTNILNNLYLDKSLVKSVMMAEDEKQNRIEKGDLFFLMSSEDYESIGKTSVLNEDVNEIYLNSFCKGVRITDKGTFSPFMNYQLLSEKFRNSLRFEARGFTRINLKIDKVMSMPICLPPINEQKTIVSYLDFNLGKIDKAITIINTQIAKLQTLRKSLINEVVTGERNIV